MLLIRKNEIKQNSINLLSSQFKVVNFEFESFYYGNNALGIHNLNMLDKCQSISEEHKLIRDVIKHSYKNIEISVKSRAYSYLMARLKSMSIEYVPSNIDILSFYFIVNLNDEVVSNEVLKTFWNSESGLRVMSNDIIISSAIIMSYIESYLEKNKNVKKIDYISTFFEPSHYGFSSPAYCGLRERCFILNNFEIISKKNSNLYKKEIDEHKKYIKNLNHIYCNDIFSVSNLYEKFNYIPEDIFVLIIESLFVKMLVFPYSGNLLFSKNVSENIKQYVSIQRKGFVNKMKELHNSIVNKETMLHKCESKDFIKIYERISHGGL